MFAHAGKDEHTLKMLRISQQLNYKNAQDRFSWDVIAKHLQAIKQITL